MMRNLSTLILALALISCTRVLPAPVDSRAAAEPVIAAERAFAARHQQVSVKKSFAEHAAPDGVLATPDGFRNAREFIATWPDDDDTGLIKWWPVLAGIARSGDLGFTTGPASFGGGKRFTNYFTIWKKQPDGSWKWTIDLGTRRGVAPAGGPDDPVSVVPVSTLAAIPADRARSDLFGAEDLGVVAVNRAEQAAIAAHYAPEAHLLGWHDAPVVGRAAIASALAKRRTILQRRDGGGVSAAGDLGWTYGLASWGEAGEPKRGPFLRVWQRRPEGWLILVENMHAF